MKRMFFVSTGIIFRSGCLRPPCGGTSDHASLEKLKKPLLHTFAAHVARNRRIVAFAGYLVDFVDEDYSTLGAFHVIIARLEQTRQKRLYVLAHISRLGERR